MTSVNDSHLLPRNDMMAYRHFDHRLGGRKRLMSTVDDQVRHSVSMQCGPLIRRRRGQKKTNSERGKEYRAKRKKYESDLAQYVEHLRHEVEKLSIVLLDKREACLQTAQSLTGSYAKIVREYCRIFERGTLQQPDRQQEFVQRAMLDDVRFGEVMGTDQVLEQWRLYTVTHRDMLVEVGEITIQDFEESTLVTWIGLVHVRVTRETFRLLFPHVLAHEALMQKLIGRRMTYYCTNQFQFAHDGRITSYDVEIDIVRAFRELGATADDIALILQQAMIADHFYITANQEEEMEEEEEEEEANHPKTIEERDIRPSEASRLAFILC